MLREELFNYYLGTPKEKWLSVFHKDNVFPNTFNLQQVEYVEVDQKDAESWLYAMD